MKTNELLSCRAENALSKCTQVGLAPLVLVTEDLQGMDPDTGRNQGSRYNNQVEMKKQSHSWGQSALEAGTCIARALGSAAAGE